MTEAPQRAKAGEIAGLSFDPPGSAALGGTLCWETTSVLGVGGDHGWMTEAPQRAKAGETRLRDGAAKSRQSRISTPRQPWM
jgi:hypothetical protein